MNFTLTDEQALLQRTVRDFADRELKPRAEHLDETAEFPHENLKRIADLGLMGIGIPAEYGGSGGDTVMATIAMEEIARGCAATSTAYAVDISLCAHVINEFGTEQQKRRWLPQLTSGAIHGAYGLTEPAAGSDAVTMRTRAKPVDEGYEITGAKQFISNGDQAGVLVLFTTLDPALRSRGITAFLVDTSTPGFSVAKLEKKLGIRASSTAALTFDAMRVPSADRLLDEGKGFHVAMTVLDWSRIGIAAQAVGIAQAAYEAAVAYAKGRVQFGKPIAEHQGIQWMLADMLVQIEAARLLTYRAADMHDRKLAHNAESSMAKLFASEMAERVCSKAIQVHGGYGYLRDFPVERLYRDARITQIYEGTSEVQRMVIARRALQ